MPGDIEDEDFEAYNILYEYNGLTEKDVEEYMQKLIDSGWEGDSYMVSKNVEWKGKQFKASIEAMGYEGNVCFNCNLVELE